MPEEAGTEARALIAEMKGIDPVRLENEYIRLFVNAMPEVPCAPYGSVYLEGTIMGNQP
jgi:TorA maturation chaperone TorD